MKKIFTYVLAAMALMLVSCNKEAPKENKMLVPMTFETTVTETKTTLGDANAILWKTGDALNVIEVNGEGNLVGQHTFTLSSGNGLATASFSGEVEDPSNTFYAVYPDIKLTNKSNGDAIGATIDLAIDSSTHDFDAVKDSYDPKGAIMTAVVNGEGKLSFRHAVAYFKFTANSSDIVSVKIQNAGKARIWGRPEITLATGEPSNVNGTGSDKTYVVVKGTFVSGGTYLVPVTVKNSTMGNLTMTATHSNGTESSITATAASITGLILQAGAIYDLKTPPFNFSPKIEVITPSKLDADATNGSFNYTVSNPDGVSVVSAVKKIGDWISTVAASEGTVTFTCTANTGDERTAEITLSYPGAQDVDVTITQKAAGGSAAESHVHILYNGKTELLDGVAPAEAYFSTSSSTVALNASVSNGGGIDSFDIPGTSLSTTGSIKLDSSGYAKFTTSATLNSSVSFYYVMRKSGTGKIQITPTGGSATVFDDAVYATVASQTVSLEKNTEYTIARNSGEVLLVAVVVTETE